MKRAGLIFAAALMSFTVIPPAMAQMEIEKTIITSPASTTRVEKTIVSSPSTTTFVLQPEKRYVVIDRNGKLLETYSTSTVVPEGYFIAEEGSGRVVATVGASNALMVYAPTSFSEQRALLDARIGAEYQAGRLTNNQVKDLREELSRNATLESKKTKKGMISDSNRRKIERGLNEVTAELAENISDTNRKRADLGLKVN
jgi:hypothetical protein